MWISLGLLVVNLKEIYIYIYIYCLAALGMDSPYLSMGLDFFPFL